MKEYIPGQGSYKVEEAGALTGIASSFDVDHHWGTLTFERKDVAIPARGLDLDVSSRFNSDWLYSTVIRKVSKNDGPAGGLGVSVIVPDSLMTLPFDQTDFYRIADGWAWNLPFLIMGTNIFRYAVDGRIFDLLSTITQEAYGSDGGEMSGQGNHSWTEGYEVTYGPENPVTLVSQVTIVIPEIQTVFTVNVLRSGTGGPYDFTPQYDSGLAVYQSDGRVLRFNSTGLLASVTDASGINSLTYNYMTEAGGLQGVLQGSMVSSSSRRSFCLQPADYHGVLPGDLVVIGDEVKVVFTKDDDVTCQITTSSTFDVELPIGGGKTYTIVKGRLQTVTHTDGRTAKFCYITSGGTPLIVTVLSSDPNPDDWAAGDLVLGVITIDSTNRMRSYQTCNSLPHAAETGGWLADLAANPGNYFSPLQTVTYQYNLTNEPTPLTDNITVINPAGASTIYTFQAGGFCSHSWNNAFFHRGTCRRGGTPTSMNIERPDFYINPGNYVNINRIDDNAFFQASKADYQKDENAAEFNSDNEFNTQMFFAGQALSGASIALSFASGPFGFLSAGIGTAEMALASMQYQHQQEKYARDASIAAHAGNVSAWVPVDDPGQVTANRLLLQGSGLVQAPRQNDVYAVVNATPDKLGQITRTSRNSTRVYVDYTGTPDFGIGDYVFIRTESQVINAFGVEDFGGGATENYIEVETAFSFLPDENEQVMFIYNNGGKLPPQVQYYCYYLNKPKVVRVELQDSSTEFSDTWKVVDYQYSYQVQGTTMIDDFEGGGFTVDNIDGPQVQTFEASDITLQSTTITTGVTDGTNRTDLTQDTMTFVYDEKSFQKGTGSQTRMRSDGDANWLFVNKTINQFGHPCFNAGYWGVMLTMEYEGGNVTLSDGGGMIRKTTGYRFDAYGRTIRQQISSPSLGGRRPQSIYTQYVGSSPVIDDLDPLNVFERNYLSGNYQMIFNAKHALGLIGATIEEVDAQQNSKITYHEYDPATLNVIMTHQSIVPSLSTYLDFLSINSPNFSAKNGSTVETDPTKIVWSDGSIVDNDDWSTAVFGKDSLTGIALTRYSYDPATNNLIAIYKPNGNVFNAVYGISWKSSLIVRDWKVLDSNFGGGTQYVVTVYDYDLKGRLVTKTVRLKTDTVDSDSNLYAWGGSAPKAVTTYAWDGMDRLLNKTAGDGTSMNTVLVHQFLDTGDILWQHPYMIATDSLGLRTKTFYDSRYRVIQTQKLKPNQDIAGNLNYATAWEVKIASQWNIHDPGVDQIVQTIVYTDPDEATAHSTVTRNTYDAIGRLLRVELKNYDAKYQGDGVYYVIKDITYDETKNAVVTQTYLNSNGDYRQSRIENDWLGRGPVKEIVWTGINATGVNRTTAYSYRYDGKRTKTLLPNGESVLFQYDNWGKLEKVTHPDGTREAMLYDLNQNLIQTINRRNLSTSMTYNQSDIETLRTTKDTVRGDTVVTTAHTPFGPGQVAETEGGSATIEADYEYHWSGQVNLRKQTVDALTLQVTYAYDALGNRTSMTPIGSGGSPWSQQLDIFPVFHAANPDTDPFNRTAIADHATGTNLVTIEPDYAVLTTAVKFGAFAAPVAQLGYTYDRYLRPVSLQTGDSPQSLNLTLNRDFSGNITGKNEPAWNTVPAISDIYTYDGMNRLASGEGNNNTFDELSNLAAQGNSRYIYQDPTDSGNDQMRLQSFNDGTEQDYSYDADGNTTAISNRFSSLTYDNLGRLRQIVGTETDQYWYEHTGLRVKRTENTTGTPVTTYTMFEGNNPLFQEVYAGSTRQQSWLNVIVGERILARVGCTYPSTDITLYFALDQLGSRRAAFDGTGTLVNRYRYSAWGMATQDSGSDKLDSYTGKDYDASGLLYFNARYYDATTGRFLAEDPARKGSGWYSYCDGNPVNAVDPTGLETYVGATPIGGDISKGQPSPILAYHTFILTTSGPLGEKGITGTVFEAGPSGVKNSQSLLGNLVLRQYTTGAEALAHPGSYQLQQVPLPKGFTKQSDFSQAIASTVKSFDQLPRAPYALVPEWTHTPVDRNSNSFTGSILRSLGSGFSPKFWAPGFNENIPGLKR